MYKDKVTTLCRRMNKDGGIFVLVADVEPGYGREFMSDASLVEWWLNKHGRARIVKHVCWWQRYSTFAIAMREGFRNHTIFKLNRQAEAYLDSITHKID